MPAAISQRQRFFSRSASGGLAVSMVMMVMMIVIVRMMAIVLMHVANAPVRCKSRRRQQNAVIEPAADAAGPGSNP